MYMHVCTLCSNLQGFPTCTYVCICICVYMRVCIYACVYMHMCIYACVCMHTHYAMNHKVSGRSAR
jgi:hypothetical protein